MGQLRACCRDAGHGVRGDTPPAPVTPEPPGKRGRVAARPPTVAEREVTRVLQDALVAELRRTTPGGEHRERPARDGMCRLVAARLRDDAITIEDLRLAAIGIVRSQWHRDNGQVSLQHVMKPGADLDRFIGLGSAARYESAEMLAVRRAARDDATRAPAPVEVVAPGDVDAAAIEAASHASDPMQRERIRRLIAASLRSQAGETGDAA